jgi:hypothetical protein
MSLYCVWDTAVRIGTAVQFGIFWYTAVRIGTAVQIGIFGIPPCGLVPPYILVLLGYRRTDWYFWDTAVRIGTISKYRRTDWYFSKHHYSKSWG